MDRRLRKLAAAVMDDLLSEKGFAARRATVTRSSDGIIQAISFGRGKWLSKESYPVTAIVGVIAERAREYLGREPRSTIEEPTEWELSWRIGFLMPVGKDYWWDLGPEGSDQERETTTTLARAVAEFALPTLDLLSTEEALLGRLEERFSIHCGALPYEELTVLAALAALHRRSQLFERVKMEVTSYVDEEPIASDDVARLEEIASP